MVFGRNTSFDRIFTFCMHFSYILESKDKISESKPQTAGIRENNEAIILKSKANQSFAISFLANCNYVKVISKRPSQPLTNRARFLSFCARLISRRRIPRAFAGLTFSPNRFSCSFLFCFMKLAVCYGGLLIFYKTFGSVKIII